ncbi:N-acetylglucosamine-6-phosphate deacetylase [Sutcliffiella horikoshii]|uniref:N-acetylglucosamine-6-phosphate deacetylase n=1 Tax=Sutcliffiella horikoshii TaxID=79883 RepID=A0A5D4SYQ4_9BACI|nr:N-acetylglucosamine-6-phosphate deacetylase [Sutcliffiella horikoshii]TYS67801.1 N-acetylglucosamine-6-phosphate deacetylase [Sutcliffiella horikoshii]
MSTILNSYALLSVNLIKENTIQQNGFIKVKEGKIFEIGAMDQYQNTENFQEIRLSSDLFASPGFIDIHIHGLNGSDTMDASEESLKTMCATLPKEGTTSFLATTITQERSDIEAALRTVNNYLKKDKNQLIGSELLGIHLEGPFISPKRAGAQPLEHIVKPDIQLFESWQTESGNHIKVVTMAPEQPNGIEFVHHLTENKIITSIGHSDAVYHEMLDAMEAGAEHVTHFYNGMRGSHHREPGVVGAGLAHEELLIEMIADGIHVHPAVVKATYLAKGPDRILLITDSMRAKWLEDGEYELGGQKVAVANNTALLENGTLAGSVLKMNEGLRNMKKFSGCTLEEAVRMASTNPAKRLNVWERKGSIEVGKDADIVIMNQNFEVKMTFCNGQLVYKGE